MHEASDLTAPLSGAPAARSAAATVLMMAAVYCIFFSQYMYASIAILAPFFPTSEAGRTIGVSMVGLVFSCYPLGTVLATPLPPLLVSRCGVRTTICLGLLLNAISSFAFGLVPSVSGTDATTLSLAFMALRAVGGVGAALSEAAAFTVLATAGFGARLGFIMSTVEVLIGLSQAGGTFAGGLLYAVGASTVWGAFAFPFVVSACGAVALVPLVWVSFPGARPAPSGAAKEAKSASAPSIWTFARLATLVSTLAGSGLVEAPFPTLPPVLEDMGLGAAAIGSTLSLGAIAYMLSAIIVGVVIDRCPGAAARRSVMVVGWALMATSYLAIGPLSSMPPSLEAQVGLVAVGVFLQGVGSGGIIVPSLPDAEAGLVSEGDKATVCAAWNSCYSGGAALGPVVAAALGGAVGFDGMCTSFAVWGALSMIALVSVRGGATPAGAAINVDNEHNTGKPALTNPSARASSVDGAHHV